jgi:hypothetical protein
MKTVSNIRDSRTRFRSATRQKQGFVTGRLVRQASINRISGALPKMTDTKIPSTTVDFLYSVASRRSFLRTAAATAIAGGTLAACTESKAQKTEMKAADASGGTTAPNPAMPSPAAAAAAMDAMHEAGIKAFPAKTEGKGNQLLKPTLVAGVKVFDITASQIQWETAPGQKVEAWA